MSSSAETLYQIWFILDQPDINEHFIPARTNRKLVINDYLLTYGIVVFTLRESLGLFNISILLKQYRAIPDYIYIYIYIYIYNQP